MLFQAIEDESNGRGMGYGMGSGGAMKCARGVPMACGAMGAPGGADVPIAVRTNFAALACVHADVRTDAAGACTVPVPLPDSLTKYHVIAVACTAQSVFGVGGARSRSRCRSRSARRCSSSECRGPCPLGGRGPEPDGQCCR